jgi:hypothetical protein
MNASSTTLVPTWMKYQTVNPRKTARTARNPPHSTAEVRAAPEGTSGTAWAPEGFAVALVILAIESIIDSRPASMTRQARSGRALEGRHVAR